MRSLAIDIGSYLYVYLFIVEVLFPTSISSNDSFGSSFPESKGSNAKHRLSIVVYCPKISSSSSLIANSFVKSTYRSKKSTRCESTV
jgi:hypothetical protein